MSTLTLRNSNRNDILGDIFGSWGDIFSDQLIPAKRDRHDPIVKELDNHFEIAVAAPGLEKADFVVTLDGNQLTLGYDSGEKKHRYAYASKYSMSYTIPSHCDVENIGATYKNGVLVVNLPKTEASKSREIKIK